MSKIRQNSSKSPVVFSDAKIGKQPGSQRSTTLRTLTTPKGTLTFRKPQPSQGHYSSVINEGVRTFTGRLSLWPREVFTSSLLGLRPLPPGKPSTRRRNEFNEGTRMFVIAWNGGKAQGKWMLVWQLSLVPACMNEEVGLGANRDRAPVLRGYRRFPLKRGRGPKVLDENRLWVNGSQAEK